MSTLLLDQELRAKLNGLNETVEIKTPEGETVGHFVPEPRYQEFVEFEKTILEEALARCPFSDEELARRAKEKGGMELADVWKKIGAGK